MSAGSDLVTIHRWLGGLPPPAFWALVLLSAASAIFAIGNLTRGIGPPWVWALDMAVLAGFWLSHLWWRRARSDG